MSVSNPGPPSERRCSASGCGRGGKLTRSMCSKCYRYWLDHTPPEERGIAPRFVDDFWQQVTKTHSYGCWTWEGKRDRKGYGRWKKHLAHRESWRRANGSIPDGMWILHHCDNPPCVNPAHLYPGTVIENVRDMVTRGRNYRPPLKERCTEGHMIAGENLREMVTGSGELRRYCRVCDNARSALRQREARRSRGLRKTRLSTAEKTLITGLAASGVSRRRIAAQVGRSLSSVNAVVKEGMSNGNR